MATHSTILAWKIPWTEELGGLQSRESQYNLELYDSREGNGTPLQYSCLENPMDGGAWKAAVHGVAKEQLLHYSATKNNHPSSFKTLGT